MIPLCANCETGPKGIEGHDQLKEHAVPHPKGERRSVIIFMCEVCGCSWTRNYLGSGQFGWEWFEDSSREAAGE